MSVTLAPRTLRVALIGNPNIGKSTLFNALAGMNQRVGNYPGVTVEKKLGRLRVGELNLSLIDLPGTYSLAPRSPDEMITVEVLLGRQQDVGAIDVVLCIVDASNLERNLYLVSQVLELELPTVIALNMMDVAAEKGIDVDVDRLQQRLGVPVVPLQAHRKRGLQELKTALAGAAEQARAPYVSPFPEAFQHEVTQLMAPTWWPQQAVPPRFLVERMLLDVTGYLDRHPQSPRDERWRPQVLEARQRLATAGYPVPAVEAMSRYFWAAQMLEGTVTRPLAQEKTLTDQLDHFLTHRVWGVVVFVLVMLALFQSVFWVAEPASELLDGAKSWLAAGVEARLEEGALRSLLVNGMLEGVGGVLVFLPQIFTLFFFIAVLEDCGYMARAAYLMDRLMARVGLSGKSFIPLLSSFACAIPGIMSARVIENPRDRLATILVTPLMSCSARLPVYVLLIEAFIPDRRVLGGLLNLQGLTMFAMYSIGIVAAVGVVLILKRTLLRGPTPAFVMELPSFKWPGLRLVVYRMLDRGWAFVRRAGTLIFAISILVWAAAYFPHDPEQLSPALRSRQQVVTAALADPAVTPTAQENLRAEQQLLDNAVEGEYLRQSYLGRVGRWIEPVVRPLGWDWRLGCAALASFPAREVVIATLGVIYNLGADQDAESSSLRTTLQQATWDGTERPVFNVPVALSLMVFFALCAQCASTLAVMKRETNSWRWPAFTFVYMTGLAYVAAFFTYQIGIRL